MAVSERELISTSSVKTETSTTKHAGGALKLLALFQCKCVYRLNLKRALKRPLPLC